MIWVPMGNRGLNEVNGSWGMNVIARPRTCSFTFIPQDPFTSFSPLFPIGTQIMDLMKWKSPRARNGAGPSSIFARYPQARHRADRQAVLDTLRPLPLPHPAPSPPPPPPESSPPP